MSLTAKPEVSAEIRRVYCQGTVAVQLAKHDLPFEIHPFPQNFPEDESVPFVVIGEDASVFSPALGDAIAENRARLIYVLSSDASLPQEASGTPVFNFLITPLQPVVVASTINAAFDNLQLARRQAALEQELLRARVEIDELNQIGIALSTQRDTESLLTLILQKSREITTSDAGSLYLVEETEQGEKRLRFKLTQNESLKLPFTEFTMPINASSIAGYVALTGESLHLEDVYQVPPSLPFRFNPTFDKESGYRTKSMLVVPMKNPHGEITGVVQLINCKRGWDMRVSRDTADAVVIPYPEARAALVSSLASQAAVAIENSRLYESIETLFEGFVKASVVAIEARDPTTSGHSFRVADLTVGLAEAVDRDSSPSFRNLNFTRTEMKEIRYASLLHDFGKVGVREEVLVKAKKLYPLQIDLVRQRFDFVRKAVQQEHTQRKLAYLLEKGRDEFLASQENLDRELAERVREMDEFLEFVMKCNEPTVLPEGNFQRLLDLAARKFVNWNGEELPLLHSDEVRLLSVPKGSLDEGERKEIESHVVHSFNFLSQIPWTKDIKNIPTIARAHHEKLNGGGYPYHLTAAEIPFQSKMMTISDIYDALSASDRPYKKAVPTDRALDILKMESNQLLIDSELFRIFTEAGIYKITADWKHPAGFNL